MKNSYYDRLYATRDGITSDRQNVREQQISLRRSVIKKQKISLFIVFIFIALFTLLFFSRGVYADSNLNTKTKMYKSVLIYSGDSLESIADTYMSIGYSDLSQYINEIVTINGLNKTSELVPGNHIIVPYYVENDYSVLTSGVQNPCIIISVASN